MSYQPELAVQGGHDPIFASKLKRTPGKILFEFRWARLYTGDESEPWLIQVVGFTRGRKPLLERKKNHSTVCESRLHAVRPVTGPSCRVDSVVSQIASAKNTEQAVTDTMNLATSIHQELWNIIQKSFESELYSAAILDAMRFLSDVLRERADLDGDGVSLAGQALGGNAPRLQINQLRTISEKDEQKGFEAIIRGLYQGIRNPRTHEQREDSKSTAETIILFINYVISVIDAAKPRFTIDGWLTQVFDPDFVATPQYAQLLISEIPTKRRLDTLLAAYDGRNSGSASALGLVLDEIITLLDNYQIQEFCDEISKDLRTVRDYEEVYLTEDGFYHISEGTEMPTLQTISADSQVRLILEILPERLWDKLDRVAKLRIENKLISSIKGGAYIHEKDRLTDGAFGTWAHGIVEYFEESSKTTLHAVLLNKLAEPGEERDYVLQFFFGDLPDLVDSGDKFYDNIVKLTIEVICRGVSNDSNDRLLIRNLRQMRQNYPPLWTEKVVAEIERRSPLLHSQLFSEDIPF